VSTEVIMPDLGATESVSTLLRWFVSEGQAVKQGQPIFEAESDKATIEIVASVDGVLGRILAEPGSIVPAGERVAWILQPGEQMADEGPAAAPSNKEVPRFPPSSTSERPGARSTRRVVATPLARKISLREHLDLTRIRGTGPMGRIIRADVLDALEVRRPEPERPLSAALPIAGTRGVIARRMAESAHTTAPVTLTCQAEATALAAARESLATRLGEAASYNLLLALIAAQCLLDHPSLNASLGPQGIVEHAEVSIGVAVDAERGLVVPVLRDVPRRSITDLAADLEELVRKARAGELTRDEMSGGTFTITNLGQFRVDSFTPIINMPECAVLGVGRIHPSPVVRSGKLAISTTVALSLTFDHRLVDGAPAARFLTAIAEYVEQPTLVFALRSERQPA